MDSRLTGKTVSLFLVLSVCLLGYVAMRSFGEPSSIPGKVGVDSNVQFKQNDNVSYYFATDSYVDRLEIAPTYFEINTLKFTTSVSTGNVNVTLYDFDSSGGYVRWRADQDVSTASVGFKLDGLAPNRNYEWLIDGNIVARTIGDSIGSVQYTYSGPWSPHIFVVQIAGNPPNALQASFEYIIDGSVITFTDKSYGLVEKWYWNFGDSYGSTVQNPVHKYSRAGTYGIWLTVYDNKSHSSTAKVDIELKAGPNFPFQITPGGWDVYLSGDTVIGISATGLVASGAFLLVSTYIYPGNIWRVTGNGRKILGIIMVGAGLYFFIFVAKIFGQVM